MITLKRMCAFLLLPGVFFGAASGLALAAANVANGIPPNTSNYQDEKKRLGLSAQYSFSKRYAVYLSIVDMTGFVQDLRRYAPDTPDYAKSSRLQELGYFTTIGIRGTF